MKTLKKEVIIFGIIFLAIISLVYAMPMINYLIPTPANATTQSATNVEINVSITESNLDEVKYNWNGTNFTMYDDSLVLMMNFDNISALGENDTYAVDISKYSNNFTAYNGANFISSGKYGGAFDFDGVNDELTLYDTLGLGNSKVSVSLWVNLDSTSEKGSFIKIGSGGYGIGVGGNGGWWGTNGNDLGMVFENVAWIESNTAIGTGWHHIAFVLDSNGNPTQYIDGKSVYTEVNTASIPSGYIKIGGYGSVYGDSTIDEVRIWNRSLSDSEIYQVYASNLKKFNSTQWYFYVNQSLNATEGLDEGDYTYFVSSKDSAGNENTTKIRTITISSADITSPTITINSPINNTNSSDNGLNISYTASDTNLDSCWYSNDTMTSNTTLVGCANITTIIWNDVQHNVTIWTNDSAGNENSSSVTFTIDTTDPTWENNKTNLTSSTTSESSVYFNIILNDTNPDKYIFSWYNGTDWANDTVTSYMNGQDILVTKTIPISSGDINWTWYFNDTVGNTNQTDIWSIILSDATDSLPFCGDGTCNDDETCSSCSTDCGSCSSGGSGSYLLESSKKSVNLKFRTHLSPGKSKLVKIKSDKETALIEMEIKAKNWLTGEIEIISYNEVPDFCDINYDSNYILYKALEINSTFNSSLIDEARLRINVLKDWVYENNISTIKAVKCNPYYKELKIDYINETNESGIYDIYSNGFSTLAILGTLSINENSRGNDDEKNWIKKTNRYSLLKIFLIIILILIIVGIMILLVKHRIYLKEKVHTKFFDFEFKFRIGKK